MKQAVLVSTGELIDASKGSYNTTIKNTAICSHCKHPVYWRASSERFDQTSQKIIKTNACWVHYSDADKTCPFYVLGQDSSIGSITSTESRGQREKLLLERFAEVVSLALNIPNLEARSQSVYKTIKSSCVLPPARFKLPISPSEEQGVNAKCFLLCLGSRLSRSKILSEANYLNAEAYDFLVIPKNTELLNQLLLVALEGFEADVLSLNRADWNLLTNKAIAFLSERFAQADFHQAYSELN